MPFNIKDFDILKPIGCGAFGECHKVRRKQDKEIMAMKCIDYSQLDKVVRLMICNEVNFIRQMDHPHIIRYYGKSVDQTKGLLYVFTEYCEGGDLSQLINQARRNQKALEESQIWEIFCQLTTALEYCQNTAIKEKIVLHRDVKPANIFIKSPRCVVLGDFGISRYVTVGAGYAHTVVGTLAYMAPECFSDHGYNAKADIWSLGCVIHELCCLKATFTAPDSLQLEKKIKIGKVAPLPSIYSDRLKRLVKWLLTVDKANRPSSNNLIQSDFLKPIFECNGFGEMVKFRNSQDELNRAMIKLPNKGLTEREIQIAKKEKALDKKEKDLDLRARLLAAAKSRDTDSAKVLKQLGVNGFQKPKGPSDYLKAAQIRSQPITKTSLNQLFYSSDESTTSEKFSYSRTCHNVKKFEKFVEFEKENTSRS